MIVYLPTSVSERFDEDPGCLAPFEWRMNWEVSHRSPMSAYPCSIPLSCELNLGRLNAHFADLLRKPCALARETWQFCVYKQIMDLHDCICILVSIGYLCVGEHTPTTSTIDLLGIVGPVEQNANPSSAWSVHDSGLTQTIPSQSCQIYE